MTEQKKKPTGIERRRSTRRQVVDAFSISVVIPSKGDYMVKVHDLSDQGIGFDYEAEGETPQPGGLKRGENLTLHLYINRSLFIPLAVRIIRIEDDQAGRRMGGELLEEGSPAHQAYLAFLQLIDKLSAIK